MKALQIAFEPISPVYFGSEMEIRIAFRPSSRAIPTIYTMAGALLSFLSDIAPYEMLRRLIVNDELRIYGVYTMINGRAYIPAPFDVLWRDNAPLRRMKVAKARGSSGFIYRPMIEAVGALKGDEEYCYDALAPLDKLPEVHFSELVLLKPQERERIGIALDRVKKVTIRELLYSLKDIEAYELRKVGERLSEEGAKVRPKFCVDVTGSNDLMNDIEKMVKGFCRIGGEHGIAFFEISRNALLLEKCAKLQADKAYMAVSHLPIKKEGMSLVIEGIGSLKWSIGSIELLSGWDYAENKPKAIIAAMRPGTVFELAEVRSESKVTHWYKKLLRSIVEIAL